MLFNSYEFIFLFLPATFFIFFWLNTKRLIQTSKAWLVFASLFFYSWWNIIYLPLILASILFNFSIGSTMTKMDKIQAKTRKKISRKTLVVFGIISNILLLGYFKYGFFYCQYNTLFKYLSQVTSDKFLLRSLILSCLPMMLKRYYLNYTLFVTFFPHLLAGPILHHKEMMPQFDSVKSKALNYKNISIGLFLFSIGLFKKAIVADTFAVWATNGFDVAITLNLFEAWATSLSYTFQLYFDFSGYTDMAIGIALLFNIRLPENFNSPYKATNIQDFWRRWHITLGRFLKDYLYIPLGGNKKSELRTYANLLITFIIGGLWHGAGWTFIFWGVLHGSALVIHRIWSKFGFNLQKGIAWFITFNFINITWIFFRANTWHDALKVLQSMFSLTNIVLPEHLAIRLNFLHKYGIKFNDFE
jgi:D-alanyl-lipoteichoic acid acyltransferase DltB (MBOAT superfamily)